MDSGFTLDGIVRYGLARRRSVALCCLAAMVVAGAVSALQTRRYTAVSRLIVEPGPASPLRNATSETPLLQAMLAGYEQMAHGDALFAAAAGRTGLADPAKAALATRIVAKARVLEISFTDSSAAKAHEMALSIAQETVRQAEALRNAAADQIAAEAGAEADKAHSWATFRGEYVRLLDEGVVPREPSSPRILLNVMGAAVLALALSGAWVVVTYALNGSR